MIVVSFFTAEYRDHAPRLRSECDRLGLRHRIEELPTTGSYLRNCCLKPGFILDSLRAVREPVLWVDVDSSICAYPAFFSDSDPYDMQARRMRAPRKRAWHVSAMWWNYTPDALAYLERWAGNVGESEDEAAMEKTWREGLPLRTRDIPAPYFQIEHPEGAVILIRLSRTAAKRLESKIAARYEQEVM
ncbi:MAG: hypothetical protein WC121_11820 [Candidatus Kapaibacterium sp.]